MQRTPILEARSDDRRRAAGARLGTVLRGKWELRELLGLGATASVYLGIHRNGSRVAIKMLHPELARQREPLRRFMREAHLANKVEHPSIVRVLDDDIGPDGTPFLVMDFVDGEPLSEVLAREGPFDTTRAALTGVKILDALAAAHAKGITHRDIKPANIALERDGSVKLFDFGIARLREGSPMGVYTREGLVMGTPAFMAPEQALGLSDQVDPRTDVWAVGATLYMLMTGRTVRDEAASANEALLMAMWKPVAPIATRRPAIPTLLAAVIDRALALEKRARWSSALAMKEVLERATREDGPVPFTCILQPVLQPDDLTATGSGTSAKTNRPSIPYENAAAPDLRRPSLPMFTGPRLRVSHHAGLIQPRRSLPNPPRGSVLSQLAMRLQRARLATCAAIAIVVAVVGLTGFLAKLGTDVEERTPRPVSSESVPSPTTSIDPMRSASDQAETLTSSSPTLPPFTFEVPAERKVVPPVMPAPSTVVGARPAASSAKHRAQAPSAASANTKTTARGEGGRSPDPTRFLHRGRF